MDDAEALELARSTLSLGRVGQPPIPGLGFFEILIANGLDVRNKDTEEALLGEAFFLLLKRQTLPDHIREYLQGLLQIRQVRLNKKIGRGREANGARDLFIAKAVYGVTQMGYRPTRNRATKDKEGAPSACSIVATALADLGVPMGEAAVEKIWVAARKQWVASREQMIAARKRWPKALWVGPS